MPEGDWQHLRDAMLVARVARVDTPWDERRRDVTIRLWSDITSGDPALAPMALTATAARRCTDQAVSSYTTLRRRAAPALEAIVRGYAEQHTKRVDRAATAALPSSRYASA
ncbi:hypothetical protein SAMN05661080_00848 [Modestobacter sp. DSM 44400]|uniref:hypothetical protein n=1 Tax=Modestobacter sp. DSM 44400 TaxID=1550230 RepID=UPI00089A6EA7|nr:hypothetical protein [Modestobacter sp. DSM 44400]SDX68739.1 hypothetical protein SAMN05661080_00848 [Modestobacter sp. DSM 44400]